MIARAIRQRDSSVNFSLHLVTLSRDPVRKSLIEGKCRAAVAGTEIHDNMPVIIGTIVVYMANLPGAGLRRLPPDHEPRRLHPRRPLARQLGDGIERPGVGHERLAADGAAGTRLRRGTELDLAGPRARGRHLPQLEVHRGAAQDAHRAARQLAHDAGLLRAQVQRPHARAADADGLLHPGVLHVLHAAPDSSRPGACSSRCSACITTTPCSGAASSCSPIRSSAASWR